MPEPPVSPGQAAEQAFRTGVRAAAVAGLGAIGALVWFEVITPIGGLFALVVLFPTYLLVVASALSRWLGLGKDASNLRRVTRTEDPQKFWR
jgi:hypothetical protein